jgi:hypothetical protein
MERLNQMPTVSAILSSAAVRKGRLSKGPYISSRNDDIVDLGPVYGVTLEGGVVNGKAEWRATRSSPEGGSPQPRRAAANAPMSAIL